jgi:hypothetical protein
MGGLGDGWHVALLAVAPERWPGAPRKYCNSRANRPFAQPIIKTFNLHSILHSMLNGFLMGSECLAKKDA